MLKRTLLIICCICGSIGITIAQKKKKLDTLPQLPAHIKLRISPLAFIEPDAGIMIGGEWQYNKKFSIGIDIAYLFIDLGSAGYPLSGYKIRPEFRYYFKQRHTANWFVAAEASYKHVARERSSEVCVGPGCAYFQRVEYKEIKSIPGASVKIGVLRYFNTKQKMYIECFLGLGFKVINKTTEGYDPGQGGVILNDEGFSFFEEGFSPHLPAGVKIGMRL